LQTVDPGIQLTNIASAGETTTSFLGAQLAEAEAFLRANRGHVPLVTIDIGGNDLAACGTGNAACIAAAFAAIDRNVATIAAGLIAAAGPETRFAMMTYYDPLLEDWVTGSGGQAVATQSVPTVDSLNARLVNDFGPRFLVADVANAFSTDDTTDIVNTPKHGAVPLNVALICQFTGGCDQGFNLHANSLGHQLIADTFFAAITDRLTPPSNVSPPGVSGNAVRGHTLTEMHGSWTNSPTSFNYQWEDCSASGAKCFPIVDATARTYTLAGADVGHTIRVQESATNARGTWRPRGVRCLEVGARSGHAVGGAGQEAAIERDSPARKGSEPSLPR
jgi:lysophospholipase L1-like esterase